MTWLAAITFAVAYAALCIPVTAWAMTTLWRAGLWDTRDLTTDPFATGFLALFWPVLAVAAISGWAVVTVGVLINRLGDRIVGRDDDG